MFLFALLVIVAAVYTTRKTPEKLVNRDQTEEWKGWMQVQLRKWISHWGQKRKLFQTDITAALHRNSWLSLSLSTETQRIFVPSCVLAVCRRGSRINTDRFPERAPKVQASREVRKMFPWNLTPWSPLSWVCESFRQDIGQFHSPRMKLWNLTACLMPGKWKWKKKKLSKLLLWKAHRFS